MESLNKILWFLVRLGKTQTPDHKPRNKQGFLCPWLKTLTLFHNILLTATYTIVILGTFQFLKFIIYLSL